MQEDMMRLFSAHTPAPETVRDRFELFFTDQLSVSSMIKKPENVIPPFRHAHDEYEFIIPHTPVPYLLNEGAVYFGAMGYVFPVQSGRSHGVKYAMADISHTDIVVNKVYFEALMARRGVADIQFNYEFRVNDDFQYYLDAFKRAFRTGPADEHKLRLLGELMCIELITLGTDPRLDTRKAKHGYQKGVQSIAEFLNENYHRKIVIEELAAMCGFSKNYFIKMFKDSLGDSPHAYLSKLRISRAKLLLDTTDNSIRQIAERCGFQKANSFTAQFKATTGITPKEYRESRVTG